MDRLRGWMVEKLNPAQNIIQLDEGTSIGSESRIVSFRTAYKNIDSVNRSVNMVVNACASLD
jgi:gluconate kinase